MMDDADRNVVRSREVDRVAKKDVLKLGDGS